MSANKPECRQNENIANNSSIAFLKARITSHTVSRVLNLVTVN
jgi:hypothetical protein